SQTNPDLVYVGTGESNNRQSTSWGDGMYKSTDGGKTYTNIGLKSSKHINRVVIDPRDNDVVWVAATGPLFGPGGERGIYKTTDGGKTWKQTLKVDDDTGPNDLVIGPATGVDASATGLYRSDDGGSTWRKVNNVNARPMYFSQVRVDPNDPDVVYMGGVGLHQSLDGGKSVATDVAEPIHDDVHAIWIDPANSNHAIICSDGGLAQARDPRRP